MSLQVWLPLDGSLENLGLDDISTISTTNLSFSENGKIGACLNGYTGYFSIPSMVGKKQMSVAYWIRINTATATQWLDAFRWYSTDGTSTYSSRNEFYNNSTLTGFWFKGSSISGKSNTVGEWQHHIFTIDYNTGVAKFYINGILQGTNTSVDTTHYLTGTNFMIGENGLDTSHNDFRIYDHCLSPKEVKEISKGLIAHYPLNDMISNENLILNSKALTISCFNQANDSRREYVAVDLGQSYMNIPNGTQVTISFDLKMKLNKVTTSPDKFYLLVYNTNNKCPKAFSGLSTTISTNSLKINLSGDIGTIYKGRVSTTGFIVDRASFETVNKTNNFLEFYTDYGSNNFYEITNIKMEEGSIATPWIPNPADTLYSELGLDDNIVYDCSGYGHNGTKTSTGISCSSDSPRYSSCMDFETSGYINAGTGGKVTDEITISGWVYENPWTADPHPWSCTESGGWDIQNSRNNKPTFPIYVDTVGYVHSISGDISTPLWTDLSPGWHLFTGTYDGFNVKLYIDGELVANKSTGKTDKLPIHYHATNPILIHSEPTSTTGSNSYPACKMSDMRIYATALSAEDIKSLYETRASIDNYNNLYAYELMEV